MKCDLDWLRDEEVENCEVMHNNILFRTLRSGICHISDLKVKDLRQS